MPKMNVVKLVWKMGAFIVVALFASIVLGALPFDATLKDLMSAGAGAFTAQAVDADENK